jgi:hypothetical protein
MKTLLHHDVVHESLSSIKQKNNQPQKKLIIERISVQYCKFSVIKGIALIYITLLPLVYFFSLCVCYASSTSYCCCDILIVVFYSSHSPSTIFYCRLSLFRWCDNLPNNFVACCTSNDVIINQYFVLSDYIYVLLSKNLYYRGCCNIFLLY